MTQVSGSICSGLADPHCGQVLTASKSITAYFPSTILISSSFNLYRTFIRLLTSQPLFTCPLQIQRQQLLQYLLMGQVNLPATCHKNCLIEPLVGELKTVESRIEWGEEIEGQAENFDLQLCWVINYFCFDIFFNTRAC